MAQKAFSSADQAFGASMAVTDGSSLLAAGWSAGYGALSVVLPAALFARGVVRQRPGGAAAAMVGIFGWELVKLVLCIAMLAAAPKLVPDLSWLALLVGLIVVMKTYWIALFVRTSVQKPIDI